MKKLSIILLICIILVNANICVFAEGSGYVSSLKIGISYGSSAKTEASFYCDDPIDITDADTASYITTIPAGVGFKVTVSGSALSSEYFSASGAIRMDSVSKIWYNSTVYRGSFELRGKSGAITVINIVDTEDYLASVLGKEMSASWPIEALKAQAVCARNYAITNLGKHSSYGFDLCNSQDCQVYGGRASEADKTRQAVNETKGVLVEYNGKVVPLYYFSCDGGYTEDSENVWVSEEGYLRGKKDIHENPEYATYYSWTQKYKSSEIEKILSSKNMSVGKLLDIRIDEVSENKGVLKLTFVGTKGEKSVTKSKTRTTLSLRSQVYTIEKHEADKSSEDVQFVKTSQGVVQVEKPVYALTSGGVKEIVYEEDEQPVYEAYSFNGHGWGHLIGMSQWGAYSMAKNGYSYKDILNFYFTDIDIVENSYNAQ